MYRIHSDFNDARTFALLIVYKLDYMENQKGENNVQKGNCLLQHSYELENGCDETKVPQKAKDALDKIDKDPETYLEDYYGGIEFKNKPNTKIGETKIPNKNITSYTEYDINPYKYGKPRGTERLVVGRDGSAWYTPDHYKTWY